MRKRQPPKVSISVDRPGLVIHCEGIDPEKIAETAATLLEQLRLLEEIYPEVAPRQDVVQIGGYSALDVPEDEWLEEETEHRRRKVGF